jgi:lipid A 4'-phosphatase
MGAFIDSIDRIGAYRRYWRTDVVVAGLLVAASIVLSLGGIDLAISRWCFGMGEAGCWPVSDRGPWALWYHLPAIIMGVVVSLCLMTLVVAALKKKGASRYPLYSLFVLLGLWIGSALLAEGLLKMNWGRPRPLQLSEFGGWMAFQPAWQPGAAGRGNAFPCGHSAAVFCLTSFYFLLRRKRPRSAVAALGVALTLGLAVGFTRVRAGGHFASDVAWGAAIVFVVNLVLYYVVLNVPAREDGLYAPLSCGRKRGVVVGLILVPLFVQALVFAMSPLHEEMHSEFPLDASVQPGALRVMSDVCPVSLQLVDEGPLLIHAKLSGYGVPGSGFDARLGFKGEDGVLTGDLRCQTRGWIFKRRGSILIRLPVEHVQRVTIDAGEHAIRVEPGRVAGSAAVALVVQGGRLTLPPGWETVPVREGSPEAGVRLVPRG